jgi:hypothetical protein
VSDHVSDAIVRIGEVDHCFLEGTWGFHVSKNNESSLIRQLYNCHKKGGARYNGDDIQNLNMPTQENCDGPV